MLDQQQGFRSGRGTADGIFTTKKPVYVLFVAFDHINRDWLVKSIRQRFVNNEETTLFQILQAITLAETLTDIFDI